MASIVVVLYHLGLLLPNTGLFQSWPLLTRGYLSVDIFFMLSGYVMAHVYGAALATHSADTRIRFVIARIARLYPLFLFSLGVMVVVLVLTGTQIPNLSLAPRALLLNVFMLQYWGSQLSWNFPSWSIGTECAAYLYFMFAARILLKGIRPWLAILGCLVVLGVFCLRDSNQLDHPLGWSALIRTLAGFSLGVLIYRLKILGGLRLDRRISLTTSAALLIFFLFQIHAAHGRLAADLLVIIACGILMFHTDDFRRVLDARPLVALGDWSYSIYLLHAPVYYVLLAITQHAGVRIDAMDRGPVLLLVFSVVALTVALASVTYRVLETPARRAVTASLNNRTQQIARWLVSRRVADS